MYFFHIHKDEYNSIEFLLSLCRCIKYTEENYVIHVQDLKFILKKTYTISLIIMRSSWTVRYQSVTMTTEVVSNDSHS